MNILVKIREKGILGTIKALKRRALSYPNKIFISIKLKQLLAQRMSLLENDRLDILEIRQRTLNFIESLRIIDSCLRTQNKFGGFGVPANSSACEDIDSIDPLVRLYFLGNYRKEEIKKSLERAIVWVLVNMNEDGGFVFRRMEPFVYGHKLMSSGKDESAMFPTWFRTLSLAYLAKALPTSFLGKFDWQFIRCPGYQFWNI